MIKTPGVNSMLSPLPPRQPESSFRQQYEKPRFLDTPLGFGVNAGLNVGAKFLDYWLTGKAQERTARLSDKYQQLAEARADKRNRELMFDQPFLSAEGRRKAGLNPYGDAVLPGMSGASNIATEAPAMPSFLDSQRLTLDGYVALKQLMNDGQRLSNETLVAQSQANLNNANAERALGQEQRDDDSFQYNLDSLIASTQSEQRKARMLELDLLLREYTFENDKALSNVELEQAYMSLAEQIANVSFTTASTQEKMASTANLYASASHLAMQTALAEAGIELTYAQVQQVWSTIANTDADTLLKQAKTDLEREAIKEVQARVKHIEAETKEIPASARVDRNVKRVKMWSEPILGLSEQALKWYGAFATGGLSVGASSLVTPAGGTYQPSDIGKQYPGIFDASGNVIR